MEEFNVTVKSNNDSQVVKREDAIRTARKMIQRLVANGFDKKAIFVKFFFESTRISLGSVSVIGYDLIQLNNVDSRLTTIKAMLD